jgi:NitT/TauT family transport system permease protein
VPALLVWAGLLAAWEIGVRSGMQTGLFLPAPSRVAAALVALIADGTLLVHVGLTLGRIASGLLVGGTLGLLFGLGMGTSPPLRRVVDPVVAALHPIPRLAFFPLLIVVFGVGESSKLAAVSLGAFFPMLLNTVAGVRGMNPVHVELGRNYGATRRQMFTAVLLPGSLPLMLTGLRLASNAAFHSTIGVEMVGSRSGIGSLLWLSWQTFRIDQLYAVLVVIAAIGIGLAALIGWVTTRSAPWIVDRPAAT